MAAGNRAATTTAAGVLMLALTAGFAFTGLDAVVGGIGPEDQQRMVLLAVDLEAAGTLFTMLGAIVLVACVPYALAALLVLRRRASGREGALLLAGVYGFVALATAGSTILSGEATAAAWVGLLVAVGNAAVVVLLLDRRTRQEIEDREHARLR